MQEVKKIVVIGPESTGKSTICKQLADHYNTLWCPEYAREYLLENGSSYTYEDLLKIAKGQVELEDRFINEVENSKYEIQNTKLEAERARYEIRNMKYQRNENFVDKNMQDARGGSEDKVDSVFATTNYKSQTTDRKLIFIDTNMYVMKVWCEYVFGKCHQFISDEISKRNYDLYLLMDIDLPWTKDELREYPDFETRKKLYHTYHDILQNQQVPWVNVSGNLEKRVGGAIAAVETICFT